MQRIGFIGLGIMGRPMAKNLLKAGYSLLVFDINKDAVDDMVKAGAEKGDSIKDVSSKCNIIITMLPDSPQVKEVILGEGGVLEGAAAGSLIIDMSSIAPMTSIDIEKKVGEKGLRMIDAPVSGGEPKAIDGSLSIMAGGSEKDYEEAVDILKCMGKSVVRVGGIGSGNITKLANQIIVALNIAAMSEALTLAVKAGVDPELVYNAIRGGLAGSVVLDAKAPMVLNGNYKPGFKLDLHIKDLNNALATANEIGVPLMLTSQVMQIMQALKVDGEGQSDHSVIARFYEKLAKVEIRKNGL